jgi:hypothetical protein
MLKSVMRVMSFLAVVGLAAGAAGCVPNASREAREIQAQNRLRAINKAQILYSAGCGNGGLATSFKALRSLQAGTQEVLPSPPFTDAEVVEADGYRVRLSRGAGAEAGPADCTGSPTATAFYAWAEPLDDDKGTRSFATNSGQTLWELKGLKAPAEPFGAPSTPIP